MKQWKGLEGKGCHEHKYNEQRTEHQKSRGCHEKKNKVIKENMWKVKINRKTSKRNTENKGGKKGRK